MEDIVIVSAVRTAIGKFGGSLKDINSGNLAAKVIEESIKRAGINSEMVDEVVMGEVRQATESSNVARVAALRAGIPDSATAFTINRLCGSGMQAVASGVQQLITKQANIIVAGGVENMSRAPMYLRNSRFGEGNPYVVDSNLENGQQPMETWGDLGMGMTAENVAERYGISREEQDTFAFASQQKAVAAIKEGRFKDEIVPVEVKKKKETIHFDTDEFPRETSMEKLATLKPVFKQGGTVTAGNACGRNDGATAIVLMTRSKANELGLKPMAKILDWATSGVSPDVMGLGPVSAVKKLLTRTGMNLDNFGLIELNEAFAAQVLGVARDLNLNLDKLNVNGGAIALGHPVGASGARIITTLLYQMRRQKETHGLATLCIGGGQGMAIALELL
ncbi:thiolase family protein [Bacillus sp. OK048]|uniref:thiolase family protein n=1 Tax=Bacillus sp. OK048 TaxID=1882761 RepID=UPI00088BEA3E|nr:thiolase family protein [Bacillus sp. OK048]SDL95394.1 acetyl-CoA C-acetyltransferase [Bacillus sp. OK048]